MTKSATTAYLCICVALLLLLALSLWGAYRDVRYLRATLLQVEIAGLRTHAERTVGRMERDLEFQGIDEQPNGPLLEAFAAEDGWLQRHWDEAVLAKSKPLYAAIADDTGRVVLHTDPDRIGERLGARWYERKISGVHDEAVATRSQALTGGQLAYDAWVPIYAKDRLWGTYHVGLDASWFDAWVRENRRPFLRQRAIVVGGILLIVLLATTSLFYIATHAVGLRRAISRSKLDRATEVAQLAAGLAHEIRNPLHAIRMNLHALAKVDEHRRLKLTPEDHEKLLRESNREIQRVEQLMRELVNFASPEEPRDAIIDLKAEVQSTIDFIERELMRQEINIETDFVAAPVRVRMDPGRLRQLLLNLLQNAEQALEGKGTIRIAIKKDASGVCLEVADDGPGIPEQDRQRIFEPFHSTKPDGSGLGLPLVYRFVNEARGSIQYEPNSPRGSIFRIYLPHAHHSR